MDKCCDDTKLLLNNLPRDRTNNIIIEGKWGKEREGERKNPTRFYPPTHQSTGRTTKFLLDNNILNLFQLMHLFEEGGEIVCKHFFLFVCGNYSHTHTQTYTASFVKVLLLPMGVENTCGDTQ